MEHSVISEASDLFNESQCPQMDSTTISTYNMPLPELLGNVDKLATPITPHFPILHSLDITTPISPHDSIFGDSQILTPVTPVTPYSTNSERKFNRYPLEDKELEAFVLTRNAFILNLRGQLGSGGSSYVYDAILSEINNPEASFYLAAKIPIGKSKCNAIIKEAKFALQLKHYINEGKLNNDSNPFIECLGLYYLNKETFPLYRRMDELPCLLLKKMDTNLNAFINERKVKRSQEQLKVKREWWWDLCNTLLRSLKILRDLNMVHCDLKTENVMIEFQDDDINPSFKVIDFSSVSNTSDLNEMPDLTYLFSAPELLKYDTDARPNFDTDLFSVGLILLNAATGSLPYPMASHDQFYQLIAAQEGKPLEWITPEDSVVLNENPDEARLISHILRDRCNLDFAFAFTSKR